MSQGAASEAAARRFGQVRLAAVPLLVALAALIALDPRWNARLQSAWFDACQTLWPRPIVSMPATIVEVDHKSLAALGQWPWPRSVLAQLIDDIARHRPAAIGIDIVMPEADAPHAPSACSPVPASSIPRSPRSSRRCRPATRCWRAALAAAPTVLAITGSADPTGMPLRAPPFGVLDSAAARDRGAGTGAAGHRVTPAC